MAGKAFIKLGQTGIGTQTTTERNAGVSTVTGTMTYDVTTDQLLFYGGNTNGWVQAGAVGVDATVEMQHILLAVKKFMHLHHREVLL